MGVVLGGVRSRGVPERPQRLCGGGRSTDDREGSATPRPRRGDRGAPGLGRRRRSRAAGAAGAEAVPSAPRSDGPGRARAATFWGACSEPEPQRPAPGRAAGSCGRRRVWGLRPSEWRGPGAGRGDVTRGSVWGHDSPWVPGCSTSPASSAPAFVPARPALGLVPVGAGRPAGVGRRLGPEVAGAGRSGATGGGPADRGEAMEWGPFDGGSPGPRTRGGACSMCHNCPSQNPPGGLAACRLRRLIVAH